MERALTYVLGYLLQTDGAGATGGNTLKDALRDVGTESRALAIKLRADNDFYSQTSQARKYCTHDDLKKNPKYSPGLFDRMH